MLAPAPCDRIGLDRAVRDLVRLEQDREADNASLSVANDAKTLWCLVPPREQLLRSRSGLVTARDRLDHRSVCGSSRLDREQVLCSREERLADHRVLDQIEHVGGVAPELGRRHRRQLAPELPPRGPSVAAMRGRVGAAQGPGDRLADRVVDDEPVVSKLHEGESA